MGLAEVGAAAVGVAEVRMGVAGGGGGGGGLLAAEALATVTCNDFSK